MRLTWCVRDRNDQWCAVASTSRPAESDTSIPTKCGHFIILPHGTAKRLPTCCECRAALDAEGER